MSYLSIYLMRVAGAACISSWDYCTTEDPKDRPDGLILLALTFVPILNVAICAVALGNLLGRRFK